jgi:TonB family protein
MRRAPWGKAGALALTVLAHLALLLGAGRHGSTPPALPQRAPVAMMVALLPEPAAARTEPDSAAAAVLPLPAAPSLPADSAPDPAPAPDPDSAAPSPSAPQQAGNPPQFFPRHELNSPPTVASGLARGEFLELPGTSGGYVTVRFWINALGEVVRAQIVNVDENEDDEETLLAALRQVRFMPARIGQTAVPGELQMELRVVHSAGL